MEGKATLLGVTDKNQTAQNRKDKNRKFAMKEQSNKKQNKTIKEPRRVSASLPLSVSIKVFPLKSLRITQE